MTDLSFDSLCEQHRYTKLGELVMDRMDQYPLQPLYAQMKRSTKSLPKPVRKRVAEFLDEVNRIANRKSFWKAEVPDALELISGRAKEVYEATKIEVSEEQLCILFELAVMNYAFSAYKSGKIKRFIKSSVGRGLLDKIYKLFFGRI